MNHFRSLRLATQLLSAFVLVALIAGVIGVIGIRNLDKMAVADRAVYQNAAASGEPASTSEEVSAQAMELQATMGFFALAAAPGQRRPPSRPPFQAQGPEPRRPYGCR
jgi:methyl-accepting chemotaxis protein